MQLSVFISLRRQAILTKTEKVGALPQHLTRQIRRQINLTSRQVKNSPAGLAKEMAVLLQLAIKARASPASVNLPGQALLHQKLQIAINRAQTNLRQLLAHSLVDHLRSGVLVRFSQHFHNRLTLPGHPAASSFFI